MHRSLCTSAVISSGLFWSFWTCWKQEMDTSAEGNMSVTKYIRNALLLGWRCRTPFEPPEKVTRQSVWRRTGAIPWFLLTCPLHPVTQPALPVCVCNRARRGLWSRMRVWLWPGGVTCWYHFVSLQIHFDDLTVVSVTNTCRCDYMSQVVELFLLSDPFRAILQHDLREPSVFKAFQNMIIHFRSWASSLNT